MMHEDVEGMDMELASCAETLRMHPDLFPEYSAWIEVAIRAVERARIILALAENPTEQPDAVKAARKGGKQMSAKAEAAQEKAFEFLTEVLDDKNVKVEIRVEAAKLVLNRPRFFVDSEVKEA